MYRNTTWMKRSSLPTRRATALRQPLSEFITTSLTAIDDKRAVILLILDLSVAFDTIDHSILPNRLEGRFGASGLALRCFEFYLTDCKYAVHVDENQSTVRTIKSGVSQGSVLGPLLFTLYTSPLGDILIKHEVCFHF